MFTLLLFGIAFAQVPKVGEGMCFLANQPKTPTIAPKPQAPEPQAPNPQPQAPKPQAPNPQPQAQIPSSLPSGFPGKNKGLGSYFASSKHSDYTNGNSWCGFPYKDYTNGFAPDLSVMTDGTNAVWTGRSNNWASSATKYCGLEAVVTNVDTGVSKIMYIVDAFDPKWVRTPGLILWKGLGKRWLGGKRMIRMWF
jgi:hypothetical protein